MLPDKSIVIKQAPKEWGLIYANTFRRLDVELRNVHFCLLDGLDLGENSLAFGVLQRIGSAAVDACATGVGSIETAGVEVKVVGAGQT